MNPLFFIIVLLHLSFSVALVNFTKVYEWPAGLDFEWPSEVNMTKALKYYSEFHPRYMAVFGTRIFLSIGMISIGRSVHLVSLPTSSASSAAPKLTPFPSWEMHDKYGNCNKIKQATGLEVDSVGRLWVLDNHGGLQCKSKLWIFDLTNNDKIHLIHHFPFHGYLHDLVLDESPNGTFAYITGSGKRQIAVFSLERNQSWTLMMSTLIKVISIALSPAKEEPRQLYFSNEYTSELYSIPVAVLRNGTLTESPKLIGIWTADPYRMLMDYHGTMYAAFKYLNYTSSWNTSQPFEEQRFHEVRKLHTIRIPFTFSLDSSGIFWMIELYNKARSHNPSCRLLKAAVGAKPKISYSTTTGKKQTGNSALISFLYFFLVLSYTFSLWLTLKLRKFKNSKRETGTEEMEMTTLPNSVSPERAQEEYENDLSCALYRALINT